MDIDLNSEGAIQLLWDKRLENNSNVQLLKTLLPKLKRIQILAIYFRYWENLLIEEIAEILNLSWDEADQLIETSLKELRRGFPMDGEELSSQVLKQSA